MVGQLRRLARELETRFPEARSLVRPGLDAEPGCAETAMRGKLPAPGRTKESPLLFQATGFVRNNPGSDLLSHAVTHAVPSAVEGLTSVFGMGTGVTPLLWPPGN